MRKFLFKNFYLRVALWGAFCLLFGLLCNLVIDELKKSMLTTDKETFAYKAIADIRQLQSNYAAKHGGNYAPTFEELIKTERLDKDFDRKYPVVYGYVFEMRVAAATDRQPAFFSIEAEPFIYGVSDSPLKRRFYFDSTLDTIRFTEENRPAKADDPGI